MELARPKRANTKEKENNMIKIVAGENIEKGDEIIIMERKAYKAQPQFEVNDLIFLENNPNGIGRITSTMNIAHITFQDGSYGVRNFDCIKPISERPFQLVDCVKLTVHAGGPPNVFLTALKVLETQDAVDLANEHKNIYELVISPAIPEVK